LVFSSRNQAYSWVEGTFLWLIPRSLLTVGSASKTGWFKHLKKPNGFTMFHPQERWF
jgi:hypothetical protein